MRLSAVSLLLITLISLFGPFISGYSYDAIDLNATNQPPSWEHWCGTDELGRDLFTRICMGVRISLTIGLLAAIIDLTIGVAVGAAAALKLPIIMRFVDILYALPYLVIVILFRLYFGSGLIPLILSLTCMGWMTMARLTYAEIGTLKTREFVYASKLFGAKEAQIFFTHLLPHLKRTILTTLMLTIPSAIFAESFLSFMGLGVQAPMASLGSLASDALDSLRFTPWRLFIPALFISWIIFSFYSLEEALKREST